MSQSKDSMSKHCKRCGLKYRNWVSMLEVKVCDECEPEKFKELHNKNVTAIKKRTLGQEHITEHTFFPKHISFKYPINWGKAKWKRRKQQ